MTRSRPAAWLLLLALAAPAAHAGLFDDDEARKAILDLRQRQEQGDARLRASMAENQAQLLEQINLLKRSLLELNNQLEVMRAEMARLRGQDEQLQRDLSEVQRAQADIQKAQKDVQQGVNERISKLEPVKVTVDGREFLVDPEERRQYEEAMALLRKSDFAAASSAFTGFNRRYPASGYTPSLLFWRGNAQYALREYREAISSFRSLVSTAPDHVRAPESLLAIANCQMELKDNKAARRTIDELMKTYPKSEAAQAGKERLASLR
ncbi:tol-pal system protein YbgF [Piscinibacter sp. HJYY11]|uniref:tol-pal system protein YbgF n=1 Tax=Piscinibacter sp. HJYY11 TaxID=2801333 RepID=UPI00191EDC1C|nr:tol-pal system protein YbgF [Piscinibacter sp. HJYY11]MBL0727379.1 tol-pal system protein YbgF [Piscinibacter sp. HJYY11]